jgi:hypothetical protein
VHEPCRLLQVSRREYDRSVSPLIHSQSPLPGSIESPRSPLSVRPIFEQFLPKNELSFRAHSPFPEPGRICLGERLLTAAHRSFTAFRTARRSELIVSTKTGARQIRGAPARSLNLGARGTTTASLPPNFRPINTKTSRAKRAAIESIHTRDHPAAKHSSRITAIFSSIAATARSDFF